MLSINKFLSCKLNNVSRETSRHCIQFSKFCLVHAKEKQQYNKQTLITRQTHKTSPKSKTNNKKNRMCKKDTIDRYSPDHKSRESSLSKDSLTQQELSSTVSSRQNNKAITTTSHTTTMDNEEGSSSTCAAVDEPTEKMIVFLTGKPSSERSRYDKAFKFPVKVSLQQPDSTISTTD